MPNGPFGEYFHIPAIAANAWTGHPGGVTYEMFENKSTDFDAAMNSYSSAIYDDMGDEEEWIWEEDEDAVDKAIFQLKKGPAAPGSFMTPYGPALADESIAEVVQEYPGAAELTGDVQDMFAAAEDFIEYGGDDFDDFVYELEDFAEESGNDLWSVISGAGSAIADSVGNVVSGITDWLEPDIAYGAEDEFPGSAQAVVPEPEGDSIWDRFMDVLTVTETAPLEGGTAIVEAGLDWLGDQAENYFETVGDTAKFKNAVDSAASDVLWGEGASPATDAKFAKIEEDKYYREAIKELDRDLDMEGLQAMLAFIEAELGSAVEQGVVEDWVDILRQRGDDFSLAAADDIAATLDRMIGGPGSGMGEPPDVTEPAVGEGTEVTPPTMTVEEAISQSYWSPSTGITGPITKMPPEVTFEQDIDAGDDDGDMGITTVEQGQEDILPEDDDALPMDEGDDGDALPVDPLDPEAPRADYWTQFNRYFSGLRGSASYEAQRGKRALFKDAEMLFYLDTDWNDRDLDFPTTPISAGMPWEMPGDEDVKKEEAFFSNWLNKTYATQTRAERYGPDFYQSVRDLRKDMYAIRDITEDDFYDKLGETEISYDLATDRAAFMAGNENSNDRLGSLVAAYNIHPGADVWMQQELRTMYKNALSHWITSGRKLEDFMQTFVKDQPEMAGTPQGFSGFSGVGE